MSEYGQESWVHWCDLCLEALGTEAPDAPALVLAGFGGMGGLDDLVLASPKGLRSAVEIAMQAPGLSEAEAAANERLSEIRAVICREASALNTRR